MLECTKVILATESGTDDVIVIHAPCIALHDYGTRKDKDELISS